MIKRLSLQYSYAGNKNEFAEPLLFHYNDHFSCFVWFFAVSLTSLRVNKNCANDHQTQTLLCSLTYSACTTLLQYDAILGDSSSKMESGFIMSLIRFLVMYLLGPCGIVSMNRKNGSLTSICTIR